MEVNGMVIILVVIVILALVYFIIKRNKKDQKDLENELNQKEIKPEKHDDEHI